MPKLSVCIPVYNCEDYIKDAIDSVLSQDYTDFELIVLDNCSTDKTPEIVGSYNDPRLRFSRNDSNLGMMGNWNKILTMVKGEYIKILPADDFLYPGCLKAQCGALDNDTEKKIALVCGRKRIIDDKGKVLFTRGYSHKTGVVNGFKAINKVIRSGSNILGEPGVVMFRKSVLDKAGSFDASIFYTMDLDMWLRMLTLGDLYVVGEVTCAFRISAVSESTRLVDKQKTDVDNFIRKVYNNKNYRLSTYSYRRGLINSFISSVAKKVIYKLVLK